MSSRSPGLALSWASSRASCCRSSSSSEDPLALVPLGAVRQQRDDALAGAEAAGNLPRGRGTAAGGSAHEEPFGARDLEDRGVGLGVVDRNDFVHERRVPDFGKERLADSLDLVLTRLPSREDRALWLDGDLQEGGEALDEKTRDPHERARGARADDDRVAEPAAGPAAHAARWGPPVALLEDLGARRLVVRAWIRGVRKLLRHVGTWDLFREGVRLVDGALHAERVGRLDDCAAERGHELLFLDRESLGHAEDDAVPARDAHQREPDARVPGRGLDDRSARPEEALLLRVADHPDADAVLHRAAGVQELALGEDFGGAAPRKARQPDHRRVPNEIQRGIGDDERTGSEDSHRRATLAACAQRTLNVFEPGGRDYQSLPPDPLHAPAVSRGSSGGNRRACRSWG